MACTHLKDQIKTYYGVWCALILEYSEFKGLFLGGIVYDKDYGQQ